MAEGGGARGFSTKGQSERIVRGERTDPRTILKQALAIGLVGSFIVLLAMALIMLNARTTWRWVGDNWRLLLTLPLLPWFPAAIMGLWVLIIEIFDPNYPNPRDVSRSTRIHWPWSEERGNLTADYEEEELDSYEL